MERILARMSTSSDLNLSSTYRVGVGATGVADRCLCCLPFAAAGNVIGVEGGKAIGAGLAANTTLTSLNLDGK